MCRSSSLIRNELIFFSLAGRYLSLSETAFMDVDNMLLLLKQSAPIGIVGVRMGERRLG